MDVIASLARGGHRLGAGPTVHFAPTLKCDITSLCSGDLTYDTAVGGILQYAYAFQAPQRNYGFELGARFTMIEYKGKDDLGRTLPTQNGSGLGFLLGAFF